MAADSLAPCDAKSSAAMVLTMWDKRILVFHNEKFQALVSSQCSEMIENTNVFFMFSQKNPSTGRNQDIQGFCEKS